MIAFRRSRLGIIAAAFMLSLAAGTLPAGAQDTAAAGVAGANKFNRLMKTAIESNAPPMSDGIHDAGNAGTAALQPPKEAFGELPKGNSGNKVDWVKALRSGVVFPRVDKEGTKAPKQTMDMDIIREVKGSMPDVVYPHLAHTEWLDCAQCHPKVFVPKKGGNPISMAAILMGQYCGVCHGKVAFPVSECSKCHSKPKNGMKPASAPPAPPAPAATVTPAAVTVPPAPPAPAAAPPANLSKDALMTKGKAVYLDNCAGCHGENGEGQPGTFPALKGSKVVRGAIPNHVKTVLQGVPNTAMPAWAESLSDDDIAAVITFKRNSWGNNTGDVVQPATVKAAR
ncbi:MAG TPA: c(7)-type cytochrome triheme domain-containing protein [Azospirillum sp.]|nr:c(7)-type cytochrome triheme domain-containing protein [Azospirillum sp.]